MFPKKRLFLFLENCEIKFRFFGWGLRQVCQNCSLCVQRNTLRKVFSSKSLFSTFSLVERWKISSYIESSFESFAKSKLQIEETLSCWLFEKDIRKPTIFQKANIAWKIPSWYVECCFGNFTWIIPPND